VPNLAQHAGPAGNDAALLSYPLSLEMISRRLLSRMDGPVVPPDDIPEVLARAKHAAVDYYWLTGKPLGITGEVGECTRPRDFSVWRSSPTAWRATAP